MALNPKQRIFLRVFHDATEKSLSNVALMLPEDMKALSKLEFVSFAYLTEPNLLNQHFDYHCKGTVSVLMFATDGSRRNTPEMFGKDFDVMICYLTANCDYSWSIDGTKFFSWLVPEEYEDALKVWQEFMLDKVGCTVITP